MNWYDLEVEGKQNWERLLEWVKVYISSWKKFLAIELAIGHVCENLFSGILKTFQKFENI